ncbi:MAG: RNA polymerase sigma factor [Gemmatimonadota bacterium]
MLARRAAEGDAESFGVLVQRYVPAGRRVARVVLRDDHEADDAVQDGLLSAWQAIDRYDPGRPFRPWLMRIIVNAARDLQRRRQVRAADELPPSLAGRLSPERDTEDALFRERLGEALAALPERKRVAVTLFDVEGYSHAEIAELLGVPVGTVRSDVFHARRALREALAPFREANS